MSSAAADVLCQSLAESNTKPSCKLMIVLLDWAPGTSDGRSLTHWHACYVVFSAADASPSQQRIKHNKYKEITGKTPTEHQLEITRAAMLSSLCLTRKNNILVPTGGRRSRLMDLWTLSRKPGYITLTAGLFYILFSCVQSCNLHKIVQIGVTKINLLKGNMVIKKKTFLC